MFLRRLIAALLALWLPLQFGTALAVSAPMQAAGAHRAACEQGTHADHASRHASLAQPGPAGRFAHEPGGQHAACTMADAQDAACVDCAFCFASSIALGVSAPAALRVDVSSAAVASGVERFDSLNQVPPDPPPIA